MADQSTRKQNKKPFLLRTIRGKIAEYDQNNQYVIIEFNKKRTVLRYNISLIGINVPTIVPKKGGQVKQPQEGDEPSIVEKKDSAKAQPGALEYRQYLNKIMFKRCTIKLVVDYLDVPVTNKDTGGYYAFLWVKYTFINKDILLKGLAKCDRKGLEQYSNSYINVLENAENVARNLLRGPVNKKEFEAHSEKVLFNVKLLLGIPILLICGYFIKVMQDVYGIGAALIYVLLLFVIGVLVVLRMLKK